MVDEMMDDSLLYDGDYDDDIYDNEIDAVIDTIINEDKGRESGSDKGKDKELETERYWKPIERAAGRGMVPPSITAAPLGGPVRGIGGPAPGIMTPEAINLPPSRTTKEESNGMDDLDQLLEYVFHLSYSTFCFSQLSLSLFCLLPLSPLTVSRDIGRPSKNRPVSGPNKREPSSVTDLHELEDLMQDLAAPGTFDYLCDIFTYFLAYLVDIAFVDYDMPYAHKELRKG